jgi:hypothetical protein
MPRVHFASLREKRKNTGNGRLKSFNGENGLTETKRNQKNPLYFFP